jgi:hypothetical protein
LFISKSLLIPDDGIHARPSPVDDNTYPDTPVDPLESVIDETVIDDVVIDSGEIIVPVFPLASINTNFEFG